MGFLGGPPAVRLLKMLSPTGQSSACSDGIAPAYLNKSKMEVLFGPHIWDELRDKVVVDFGCGEGFEVVEMAGHGARRVIGIDNYRPYVDSATALVASHGLSDRCTIVDAWTDAVGTADVVISLDAFEHFEDPAAILRTMHRLLKPDGCVLAAFGPLWYHPYGGHTFSVFPYAHLLFSEHALVTWRGMLPGKEPKTSIMDAGINKMTVRRFERLVDGSPFTVASLEAVPIRRLRSVHTRPLREFTTSIVRCRLESRSRS